jgi:hypothetical protein
MHKVLGYTFFLISCVLSALLIFSIFLPWIDFGNEVVYGYLLPLSHEWMGLMQNWLVPDNIVSRGIIVYLIPLFALANICIVFSYLRTPNKRKGLLGMVFLFSLLGILSNLIMLESGPYHYTTCLFPAQGRIVSSFLLYAIISLVMIIVPAKPGI